MYFGFRPENYPAAMRECGPERPVWLISYHCNKRGEITGKKPDGSLWKNSVQSAGCNAVEVDIRHGKETFRTFDHELHSYDKPESFFLAHTFVNEKKDMTLSELFMDVKAVYPQVSLIVFDIKEPSYMAQFNKEIHACLDCYFCQEGYKPPYLVYSVPYSNEIGKREKSLEMFVSAEGNENRRIDLRNNEGICCDMSNDYQYIENWFASNGFERCWYGNGLFAVFGLLDLNVKRTCKRAAELRDRTDSSIKKVESWTVHSQKAIEERLFEWKCDSVILADTVRKKRIIDSVKALLSQNGCRFASLDDDPWKKTGNQDR